VSTAFAAILAVAVAVLAGLIVPPLLRRRRRRRFQADPGLAASMREAIDARVPIAACLPDELRRRLDGLVAAFLAEKRFVGCNGLAITDEIRATIAAQASLLLLGRRSGSLYDELQSVLVYPSAFWVEHEVHDEDGLVTRRRRELSGEAWDAHRIILSWEDIEDTTTQPADGYNVIVHEFAHYLDAEGLGLANRDRSGAEWHEALMAQFESHVTAVERGNETFLDPYGAEDETEFFAVVTEEFFECPVDLRAAHAELYALMQDFYGVDPAAWMAALEGES
jgi:Mlc titration factor MtfA (ptsG expression regulator)